MERESIWDIYYPRDVDKDKQAVLVASFPMIIYFWPSMIVFLGCGFLQWAGVSQTALGWAGSCALLFNLLVIVTDLNQKKFTIALLTLIVGGLLLYITSQKDVAFVGALGTWIASITLTYSTGVYFLVGGFLFVFMGLG
ncbi:MAG: hypothetical protein ACI9D0_000719, partial [Bacteroidia bacterium]